MKQVSMSLLFVLFSGFSEAATTLKTTEEAKPYNLKSAFCSLDNSRLYVSAWQGTTKGSTLTGQLVLSIKNVKPQVELALAEHKDLELKDMDSKEAQVEFTDRDGNDWRLGDSEKSGCDFRVSKNSEGKVQIESNCHNLKAAQVDGGSMNLEIDKSSPIVCEKLSVIP